GDGSVYSAPPPVGPSIPGDSGRTGRGNLIFFGCGKPEMGPFQALSRTPRRLRLPSHGHYRGVPRAERAFAFDSGKALTVMLRVDDYRVFHRSFPAFRSEFPRVPSL